MPLTRIELVKNVLRAGTRPMTVNEIWALAREKGMEKELETPLLGDKAEQHLRSTILTNLKSQQTALQAVGEDERGKLYALKAWKQPKSLAVVELPGEQEVEEKAKGEVFEAYLHPFLANFVKRDLRFEAYAATIREFSKGPGWKGKNDWRSPDMIAVHFLKQDYSNKKIVFGLRKQQGKGSFRLYSFELKKELTLSNVRESYFQAVSNSSWANLGYLVASEINDADVKDELKSLAQSFGIGVIKLDLDNVMLSDIVFPAKEKEDLDWPAIDQIAEGPDFRAVIKMIHETEDKIGMIDACPWDPHYVEEEKKINRAGNKKWDEEMSAAKATILKKRTDRKKKFCDED